MRRNTILLFMSLLMLVLLFTIIPAYASEQINGRLDILAAVDAGTATISSCDLWGGEPRNSFDGDFYDYARSANINPAFVQVAFTTQKTVNKLKIYANDPQDNNYWWVEAADTQADLDNQTGTFLTVVSSRAFTDSGTFTLTTAVSRKIWKFYVQRFAVDTCVNIREAELWGNVTIDSLTIAPASLRVFTNDTAALTVKGRNNSLNETYSIEPGDLTWQSSNTNYVTIQSPGQVFGKAIGTANVSAGYLSLTSNTCPTTVYGTISAPAGLSLTGFYSTVKMSWNKPSSQDVAGYVIYRRTASGSYGATPNWRAGNDSAASTIVYNDYGLTPGATYYYKIAAYNGKGSIISPYTSETSVTLSSSSANFSRVASFKILVVIYTPGVSDLTRTCNSIRKGMDYYYRNSLGRLNLEPTFVYINATCPSTQGETVVGVEADLRARGIYDNQYDGFYLISNNLSGWWGGFRMLGDTWGSYAFVEDFGDLSQFWKEGISGNVWPGQIWLFLHEYGHALDYLSDNQGFYMMFDHPNYNFPLPVADPPYDLNAGGGYDLIPEILKQFRSYDQYMAPHDDYIEFVDADHDRLADNDSRLPVDEARFNSSASLADTDADGLNDLQEYTAGIFDGSNPRLADTDGDGTADGIDATPMCDFSPTMAKFAAPPVINGVIDASWTKIASKPAYQMDNTVSATFYGGWDDNYLYFGVKSNKKIKVWLPIDGSGQNGRWQTDGAFAGYTDWNVVQNSDVSYGDCYDGANKTLYVDPDTSYVSLGYDPINPLAGSQAALSGSGSDWTLTFRIPKDLGPGSPYAYWPVGTPTITGVRLTEGRILGLQFIYAPQDASPNTPKYGNQWSAIAEIDRYYKCRLTQGPASISAKYKCGDPSQPNDNQIKPHLTIVNTGQTAVPLSELTVRYWYTIDGNKPQQFWVDYATRGSQNVTGSFVQTSRQGADYYLEVGFTSGAGILNPQSDSGEIQLRFNKNDWTNYTETGDYSYDPSKTIYTTWNRVTIYRNGVLIYGVEP